MEQLTIKDKIKGCIILHAVADTIGYRNGIFEFNFDIEPHKLTFNDTLEIIYDFIYLGGINDINLSGWNVSDDTILHMQTAKSLIESNLDFELFMSFIKKNFVNSLDNLKTRHPGRATFYYINLLKDKQKNMAISDIKTGGSGAAMRTSCIGLIFNGENNRNKLIDFSIMSSIITHPSPIGYLGGFTSALFTSFAIEKIDIAKWPHLLIKYLGSDQIKKYLNYKTDEKGQFNDLNEYNLYIKMWQLYIARKFIDGKTITKKNLILRTKFHYDYFTKDDHNSTMIGDNGYSSVIMAYDSLIDAQASWEKLIFYGVLHIGDSDTVGCIAASWFGAMYGMHNIPKSNTKYLEYHDDLIKLSDDIYDLIQKN